MTAIDKLTNLGNVLRDQYGTTDKYSLSDMATLVKSLKSENLLDEGQSFDSITGHSGLDPINGFTVAKANQLRGQTVAISFDLTWSGFKHTDGPNRIGVEWDVHYEDNTDSWVGAWIFPSTESGKVHVVGLYTIQDKEVVSLLEGNYFVQATVDKAVITNLRMIVYPLGGGEENLLDLMDLQFDYSERYKGSSLINFDSGSTLDNNGLYTNFLASGKALKLDPNKFYHLHFKARGTGKLIIYLFGTNINNYYLDNEKVFVLTDDWKDYDITYTGGLVPLLAQFNIRSNWLHVRGMLTDLSLTCS